MPNLSDVGNPLHLRGLLITIIPMRNENFEADMEMHGAKNFELCREIYQHWDSMGYKTIEHWQYHSKSRLTIIELSLHDYIDVFVISMY